MEYKKLFEPIKIGPVEIRNRTYVPPMNLHFSDNRGYVSDRDRFFHAARAKGGIGLTIFGVVLASKKAADTHDMGIHHLFDLSHVAGMSELAEIVHHFGAKIFIQLSPGFGKQGRSYWKDVWAPSATPRVAFDNLIKALGPRGTARLPREMTIEEIQEDIESMAWAVELAVCAGFDGIEIHSCHGYLIHQFLSPLSNKRTDQYGGSLENRARFLVEIIQRLKQKFGSAVPVVPRISANEHTEGGFTPEDMREFAVLAEQAGADAISLSDGGGGTEEALKYTAVPKKEGLDTHLLEEQGKKLKARVNIPILTPFFHDYDIAEKAIADGETDMIGSGRQSIADPEWPNKLKEGRPQDIVRCKLDDFCSTSIFAGGGCRCTTNPNVGRERFMPEYWPQKMRAKVPESLRRWRRLGEDTVASGTKR